MAIPVEAPSLEDASMMPKCSLGLFVLIAILTTGPFACAQEFSAIGIGRDTTGHVVKSKVYMSGKKVSYYPEEDNGKFYTILDLAQHTSTVINVGQKFYTQRPASQKDLSFYDGASPCPPAGATCKDLGSETLNGRSAEKWEISQSFQGQTLLTRVWVDAKLHIWTKAEVLTGATLVASTELQDIQEGPQPASLFVIPEGFRNAPSRF